MMGREPTAADLQQLPACLPALSLRPDMVSVAISKMASIIAPDKKSRTVIASGFQSYPSEGLARRLTGC
jgi:hypothetical protein